MTGTRETPATVTTRASVPVTVTLGGTGLGSVEDGGLIAAGVAERSVVDWAEAALGPGRHPEHSMESSWTNTRDALLIALDAGATPLVVARLGQVVRERRWKAAHVLWAAESLMWIASGDPHAPQQGRFGAAVAGQDPAVVFVGLVEDAWVHTDARALTGVGVDATAAAAYILGGDPEAMDLRALSAPSRWKSAAEAVRFDVEAMRAWVAQAAFVRALPSWLMERWFAAAGVRAPLIAAAGVGLEEYEANPGAYADDAALQSLMALRDTLPDY